MSYASVVLSFLMLVGPLMVLNALAPDLVTPSVSATFLSAGLFVIWLCVQAHDAFTKYRSLTLSEEMQNVSFISKHRSAEPADAVHTVQPEKVAERRPRPAAVALRSPIS